jgi:hypothetical protein
MNLGWPRVNYKGIVGLAYTKPGGISAYWHFSGDLNTTIGIKIALQRAHFEVIGSGGNPGFPKNQYDEYVRALRYLFEQRVQGWRVQKRHLIEHNVCTEADFA